MPFRCALVVLAIAISAGCASRPGENSARNEPTSDRGVAAEFASALLQETNRVRREHGRRALKPKAELDAAADDQAALMALRWSVGHHSPIIGEATPIERVRAHGLQPRFVAENVASALFGTDDTPPNAQEVASRLVMQWMESPRHRQNLLSRDFTHLGGSARLIRLPGKTWVAFGAQVFIKP